MGNGIQHPEITFTSKKARMPDIKHWIHIWIYKNLDQEELSVQHNPTATIPLTLHSPATAPKASCLVYANDPPSEKAVFFKLSDWRCFRRADLQRFKRIWRLWRPTTGESIGMDQVPGLGGLFILFRHFRNKNNPRTRQLDTLSSHRLIDRH